MGNMNLFAVRGKKAVSRPGRINRDPNNQLDWGGLKIQTEAEFTGLAGSSAGGQAYGQRGLLRAEQKYNKMSRLGSSATARELQKKAFSEMQNGPSNKAKTGGSGSGAKSGLIGGLRRIL